jgi:hypothetical protein
LLLFLLAAAHAAIIPQPLVLHLTINVHQLSLQIRTP